MDDKWTIVECWTFYRTMCIMAECPTFYKTMHFMVANTLVLCLNSCLKQCQGPKTLQIRVLNKWMKYRCVSICVLPGNMSWLDYCCGCCYFPLFSSSLQSSTLKMHSCRLLLSLSIRQAEKWGEPVIQITALWTGWGQVRIWSLNWNWRAEVKGIIFFFWLVFVRCV